MKVGLYARVSTKTQERKGTIASQVDALQVYAKQEGHLIIPEYVCRDDGYSGAMLARPELDRLRDGARAGAFDGILVLSPDRLSRKYAYLILIMEEFARFGVDVLFVEHGLSDDPQGALLLQIQGAVAEYERAKHAERYRRGKLFRAKQGEVFWTSIPYGYRRIPRRDGVAAHLEISEPDADVVRKIFHWHAEEAMSIRQIAKRLTRESYVPPKKGSRWGETTVHRILNRDAYLGTLNYNRSQLITAPDPDRVGLRTRKSARPENEWIPVSIPAVINTETFERSRARHIPNQQFSLRNLQEERWLLRRLLRCSRCGFKSACVTSKCGPETPLAHYYRCNKQDSLIVAERCRPKQFRSQPLDDLVWAEVRRCLLDPAILVRAERSLAATTSLDDGLITTQIRNVQRRLSQARLERTRLVDAYQEGFVPKAEFADRTAKVVQRIANLEEESRTAEKECEIAAGGKRILAGIEAFSAAVAAQLDDMTFHQKQDLIRKVLEEVVIDGPTVKLYFKIPLPNPEKDPSAPSPGSPRNGVSTELSLRSRSGERVYMRMPMDEFSKSLNRSDHSRRDVLAEDGLVDLAHRLPRRARKFSQKRPVKPEEDPEPFWYREDELTMRNRREDFLGQPLGENEDAFLMTARTETSLLAGERHEIIVTAVATANARETVLQITASEILQHHIADNRSPESEVRLVSKRIGALKLVEVLFDQAVERRCGRVTWTIDACDLSPACIGGSHEIVDSTTRAGAGR